MIVVVLIILMGTIAFAGVGILLYGVGYVIYAIVALYWFIAQIIWQFVKVLWAVLRFAVATVYGTCTNKNYWRKKL